MWRKKKLTPFQESLKRQKDRVWGNLPPKFRATLESSIKAAQDSGIEDRVRKPGEVAPTFELENQQGEARSLASYLEKGPLGITFYRGFWCSFCNADLANLNRYLGDFEEAGATLIAIAPEKHEYSRKISRTQKLHFEILQDPRNALAAEFGLRYELEPELKALFRDGLNTNLKLYHGDDDWTLPIPARFLVDQDGIIRYAESSADYTTRPDPDDMLEALRGLSKGR
jgi:peroxiredoxin